MAGKAPLLKNLAEPRKTATLLATARHLEAAAVDDALDLFDSLMATRLISPARRATDKARLAAMPRLEKASATLVAVTRTVLELLDAATGPVDLTQVWAAVERAVGPREQVAGAVATVAELVPGEDSWEADNRQAITARYGVVRPFVRLLAETLPLHAAPAGVTLLTEIRGGLPHPAAPPDLPQAADRGGPERDAGPADVAPRGTGQPGTGRRRRPRRVCDVPAHRAARGAAPPGHLR